MIEFTMIPKETNDFYTIHAGLKEFYEKIKTYRGADATNYVICSQYYLNMFFLALAHIYQINRNNETDPVALVYYKDRKLSFTNIVNGGEFPTDTCGIVINEEASTHFDASVFDNPCFLPAAEDMLKQTPNHFLKIFTTEYTKTLNVYTNKDLEPDTIYRLFALEASMHNPSNKILKNFLDACIEYDPVKASKVLNDYLNSDALDEERYNQFAQIISSNYTAQINSLRRMITERRSNITSYENEIARFATEIRDFNDQIQFLMTRTDEEEDKRKLFKYLLKHPYIKEFRPNGGTELIFTIESPVIYFNTAPIEKYISQEFRDPMDKTIFELFLSDKYELWTKTCIAFDTHTFRIRTERFTQVNKDLLNQPHIMEFMCFGNHRNAITESAEMHDYIGAIEQISQATMNINFYDTCVVDKMMELLRRYSERKTWKNKETGEMINTSTAIQEYIQERSNTNEEA